MRRLLSIVLLAIFSLPFVSPLLGRDLGTGADASLPACCRRAGKHHCAMSLQQLSAASHTTQMRAPRETCPYAPVNVVTLHHELYAVAPFETLVTPFLTQAVRVAQTESMWRIARDRSRQKRGPPDSQLS